MCRGIDGKRTGCMRLMPNVWFVLTLRPAVGARAWIRAVARQHNLSDRRNLPFGRLAPNRVEQAGGVFQAVGLRMLREYLLYHRYTLNGVNRPSACAQSVPRVDLHRRPCRSRHHPRVDPSFGHFNAAEARVIGQLDSAQTLTADA